MRAKQTNQKYDEAEQKSQAWMKAKDEAQSHKRMWHNYWQQAMVCTHSCLNPCLTGQSIMGANDFPTIVVRCCGCCASDDDDDDDHDDVGKHHYCCCHYYHDHYQ